MSLSHLTESWFSRGGHDHVLQAADGARGPGLANHVPALELVDQGAELDEVHSMPNEKVSLREYGIGAEILADLGLTSIRLISNNPRRIIGLAGYGLRVSGWVPFASDPDRL